MSLNDLIDQINNWCESYSPVIFECWSIGDRVILQFFFDEKKDIIQEMIDALKVADDIEERFLIGYSASVTLFNDPKDGILFEIEFIVD